MTTVGARPRPDRHRQQFAVGFRADNDFRRSCRRIEILRLQQRHVALKRVDPGFHSPGALAKSMREERQRGVRHSGQCITVGLHPRQ